MVGMISFVFLDLSIKRMVGTNRHEGGALNHPQSLFSGAAPDNSPVLWLIFGVVFACQPRCGGRDFIHPDRSDKTFLRFF
jgi:hypothetical protein